MNTNDILRMALYAGAEASDEIVPDSGKHMRRFADELYPEEIEVELESETTQ